MKYTSGSYESCANPKEFAEKVTSDLIAITHDEHMKFRLIESSDIGEKAEGSLHHPIRLFHLRNRENSGFYKLEWLEGDVGYLDLRRFYYFAEVKDMVNAAMKFLSGANAIIIDLRENGGGSGDYLSSYFLKYPTQLNSWYSREDNFLTEFWTSREMENERFTDVPLFLLTSRKTFSAAESFAYDMQVRRRATLIGDSTKGGAHSVDLFKIDDQFEIYISTARAISPVTGGNWQGTGVIPDILVPSASALDTAIVLARAAAEEFRKGKDSKLKTAVDEMQEHLGRAEEFYRENKAELGETVLDSVFRLGEKFGLINEFFIVVLAYNYSSDKDEQIQYAVLKKNIELFPKSSTAYEYLAFAQLTHGKKELAIESFKKTMELDPYNRNAAKMIKQLQGENK
jgi:tetratricopeptide (TPR) repeat protein